MRRSVLLAAFTAIAVRALIIVKLKVPPVWDGTIYLRAADHILHGHGLIALNSAVLPWHPSAFVPVGYPALIALVALLSHSALNAARVVNLFAAGIAAGCSASLGYRIAGSRGGNLAGLTYALAPGPALWASAVMPETLLGALLAGATVLTLIPVTAVRARMRTSVLSGLLIGLASLVRPHVVLSAPFVGAIPPGTRALRIFAATVCALSALVVILPWTARNCATLGACALVSTNGGNELLVGTFPDAQGGYRAPRNEDHHCGFDNNEVIRDRCLTRTALGVVSRHPLAWARNGLVKLFKTFAYEWAPVSYVRTGAPDALAANAAGAICSIIWWALIIAAIVGGRRAARAGGRLGAMAYIVLLDIVLFGLVSIVFFGDDRNHQALYPLLSAMAAGVFLPPRPGSGPELAWAS